MRRTRQQSPTHPRQCMQEIMQVRGAVSVVLVFTAAVLAYYNSLEAGFVFDDHRGILTNDDLDPSRTSLWDLFQHDFWGGSMSRVESHKSYRPLTVLSYRYLNFYFTERRPYGYHVVNVSMHAAVSVLFLTVCRLVLEGGGGRRGRAGVWSTFAALLFAVHSVHTEAVANTVGRAEVLSAIFFLAALLVHSKAVSIPATSEPHSSLPGEARHRNGGATRWLYVALTVFLSACSMLSKEQGVTALVVCAGYDVLLHWRTVQNGILSRKGTATSSCSEGNRESMGESNGLQFVGGGQFTSKNSQRGRKERARLKQQNRGEGKRGTDAFQEITTRVGVLALAAILLLLFRVTMNHGSDPIFKPYELKAAFHPNRTVRVLSFSNIYTLNAWLLLSPSALCCDWSLGSVPLITSLTDLQNVWSILLYSSLVILGLHVLREKQDHFAVGMSLVLMLVPFLPASGAIVRVGFVIAERVLYLPSLGSCLLVTVGIRRLFYCRQSIPWRYIIGAAAVYLLVIMTAKTIHRNKDWVSDLKLFESGAKVNPSNAKILNNLGMELKSAGHIPEAQYLYERTIKMDPEYSEVYFNYGNLLFDEGHFQAAAESFEKAVEFPQMYSRTLNNLATTYFRLGRWQEAEARFKESLAMSPDQPTIYNNLASLYGEMKRYKESEEMFRKAIELNPTYTEAYFNLGTLMVQMGQLDAGESHLKRALQLNPSHHGAANNLKVIEHQRRQQSGL